jgi:serine phosphatase RsbU (regulator of sigma subunit)/PAS domain-containing protein
MLGLRNWAIVLIVLIGIGSTVLLSNTLRNDARKGWELEGTNTAQSLSGALLGWLEESYAPISGLAALAENSSELTESEFLNAYDGLESRATAFFLDAVAFIEPVSDGGKQSWHIKYSTNFDGELAPNQILEENTEILRVVRVAENRFGETILGRPITRGNEALHVSPVALAITNGTKNFVIVGLVDYASLVGGLFDLRVPDGVGLKLTGRFPMVDGQSVQQPILHQGSADGVLSVPTRTVSAGAEMVIAWEFDPTFSGGPSEGLANLALISGLVGVAAITLFFAFLLQRNRTITLRVEAATKELSEKEAQLRMTLDNMPGGILVVDSDLNVALVNEHYYKFYGSPDGLDIKGANLRDILRGEIEKGYISGEGEPEEVLENRLATFKSQETETLRDTVKDGRVIQIVRKPAPGGHTISIATDITEIVEARRTEKLLREALDTFSEMIILYDKDERVIFTNNRYHEIYPKSPPKDEITKFTLEGLLRRSLEAGQISHPMAKSDPEAWLKGALESRRNKDGAHGETTHASGQTYYFRNAWTTEGGMILVQIDITERKQAEQKLSDAYNIISHSIDYASRIQRSVLPSDLMLNSSFADHFVIWEPRDVVGGDVYWCYPWGDGVLVVLGDCTGHGVPGAFMTLISTGALDQAISDTTAGDVGELVSRMHRNIQKTLGQDGGQTESDDGLELGACYIDAKKQNLVFSGARFDLFTAREGEVTRHKGSKKGIGYPEVPADQIFEQIVLDVDSSTSFYMTTDGVIDQASDTKRRGFGKKRFQALLASIHQRDMEKQRSEILDAIEAYQGQAVRRDDIAVIGFRFG